MKSNLTTMVVVLLIDGLGLASATGQINVTLTDKEGNERVGREFTYDITGINVDQPGIEVPLLRGVPVAQRKVITNAAGEITIPLPIQQLNDPGVKRRLQNSKQITVHLIPELAVNKPNLRIIELDLLLGDQPQVMQVVAMTESPYERAVEGGSDRFAYESSRGRFHLLGRFGTALYRLPHSGGWNLVEISRYKSDDRYLYYEEVGNPNRKWAFSRVAVCYTFRKHGSRRCTRSFRRKIWICDVNHGAKWRCFSWATRITANGPSYAY